MAFQGLMTLFGFVEYISAPLLLSLDLCRITNLLSTIWEGERRGRMGGEAVEFPYGWPWTGAY